MRSLHKIEQGQTVDQNCGGTAVQDGKQWGQTEIQELKNKNYLELTIMNVCKTIIVIFARFDSYYVNWTFSKNWHCGEMDLWFDLWFAHHCIRHMRIFEGVHLGGDLKLEWGCWRRQFLAIWVATFSETSEIRPTILYDDMLPLVGLWLNAKWMTYNDRQCPFHVKLGFRTSSFSLRGF